MTKKPEGAFKSALEKAVPSGTVVGISLRGQQGEPAGLMTVTAHMADGSEVPLLSDNGNVISHWKNLRNFTLPATPRTAGEEPLFTEDELLWIANAAGVDTGTSNIRPQPGEGLTASGLLALQDKLRAVL